MVVTRLTKIVPHPCAGDMYWYPWDLLRLVHPLVAMAVSSSVRGVSQHAGVAGYCSKCHRVMVVQLKGEAL